MSRLGAIVTVTEAADADPHQRRRQRGGHADAQRIGGDRVRGEAEAIADRDHVGRGAPKSNCADRFSAISRRSRPRLDAS
ncbi:MAG: hypothetical protein IPL61_23205 [Myxococcales bacterium]|nr:hypothetical protein [Myxococcales bacterium]